MDNAEAVYADNPNNKVEDAVAEEVVESSEMVDTETGEVLQPETKPKEESDF